MTNFYIALSFSLRNITSPLYLLIKTIANSNVGKIVHFSYVYLSFIYAQLFIQSFFSGIYLLVYCLRDCYAPTAFIYGCSNHDFWIVFGIV